MSRFYVWVDGIPADLAFNDVPGVYAGRDGKGWLPLAVCDCEAAADIVADAVESEHRELIERHGLKIYRNPIEDLKKDKWHAAAVLAKVKEISEYLDVSGIAFDAAWPPAALARSARRVMGASQELQSPQPATANDARDKWIYDQCCELIAYDTIRTRLAKKTAWELIETAQGIKAAAKRYAKSRNLPPIPSRQPGRPKN